MSLLRHPARGSFLLLLLAAACGGDSSGPDGGNDVATLSGTVRATSPSAALAGATVSIGTIQGTTDVNGQFELPGVPIGAATVHATRPGYLPADASVTVAAGANTHDFVLTAQEIYTSGPAAVFVPAGLEPLRGTIIILGGPKTGGFVTGAPIAIGDDVLEASLQSLGAGLRTLARSKHMALLGYDAVLQDGTTSDNALMGALAAFAQASGHAELASAPLLMYGLSAGAREASGFASRVPERTIGVLGRVPAGLATLNNPVALAVPTFLMEAGLDNVVDTMAIRLTFAANRSQGGLWALAMEPGVGHSTASAAGNAISIGWLTNALDLRLPATPGGPLVALDPASGWLGNQVSLEIAAWADYPDDRTTASWLLSQSAAAAWQALATASGGTGQ